MPALRRERIFESGQRDFGVSSKAHKFACELRALLASDKHLGSAERSERQPSKQTRLQVPEALWRIYGLTPLPPTHLAYGCVESLEDWSLDVCRPGSFGVEI